MRGSKEFKIILVKLFNDILDYEERVVFVNLSSKGEAAFSRNEELYDQMVNSMLEDLEDNEMDILMKSLLKVNRCIKQNKA